MALPYENTKTGIYYEGQTNEVKVTLSEINLNNLPAIDFDITKSNRYYYNPEPFGEDNLRHSGAFPVTRVTFSNNYKTAVIDFGLGADQITTIYANDGVDLRDHIYVGCYLYFKNNGLVHDATFEAEESNYSTRYSEWIVDGSYAEIYEEEVGTVVTFNNSNKQLTIDVSSIMKTGGDFELVQSDYKLNYTISEKGSDEPDPDPDEPDPDEPTEPDEDIYLQTVYARYQQSNGLWGEYELILEEDCESNTTFSWSSSSNVTYKATSISYTVVENRINYVDIYRNEYPIHFDSNGGVYTPPSQYYYYGGTTQLSKHRPTRSGYKFLGWSKNGTTTTLQPGDNVKFDNSKPTLKAIWQKTNQEIYLYKNGKCYANEFIEDSNKGFGKGGEVYNACFDETNFKADYEIDNTKFVAFSFVEGLPQ